MGKKKLRSSFWSGNVTGMYERYWSAIYFCRKYPNLRLWGADIGLCRYLVQRASPCTYIFSTRSRNIFWFETAFFSFFSMSLDFFSRRVIVSSISAGRHSTTALAWVAAHVVKSASWQRAKKTIPHWVRSCSSWAHNCSLRSYAASSWASKVLVDLLSHVRKPQGQHN